MSKVAGLADIYDAIYDFKDYGRDVEYVVGVIRDHGFAAGTVLDVACGTGNHIAGLACAYDVEGLDISDAMIAKARAKFPSTTFHCGDMTEFDLGREYDVVCCLFRSIAYVRTSDNFRRAIAAMSRHVAPGGLLLIEPFFTPDTYWSGRITLNQVGTPDRKISWMYLAEREGDLGIMDTHYLVGSSSGVQHFTERHEMGLFSTHDYAEAFESAGLALEYDPVGPTQVGFYIGRRAMPEV